MLGPVVLIAEERVRVVLRGVGGEGVLGRGVAVAVVLLGLGVDVDIRLSMLEVIECGGVGRARRCGRSVGRKTAGT